MLLNLTEGWAQPRGSGGKRRHYVIALGSAVECPPVLDDAAALGLKVRHLVRVSDRLQRPLGGLLGGPARRHRALSRARTGGRCPRAPARRARRSVGHPPGHREYSIDEVFGLHELGSIEIAERDPEPERGAHLIGAAAAMRQ